MGKRIPDIDWKAVAAMVITSDLSIADIGRELEIPYEAIRSRAKRGRWLKLREERLQRLEGEVALIPPDPITGSRRLKLTANTGANSAHEFVQSAQFTENQEDGNGTSDERSPVNPGAKRAISVVQADMGEMEVIADRTKFAQSEGKKRSVEEMAADIWAKRTHQHRDLVFSMGHKALKDASKGKDRLRAPKNWKDAQIADNMARKAAGLDKEEGPQVNVLINLGALNGALKSV